MEEKDQIFLLKFISVFALFLICFMFGIIPYCIESCRTNMVLLSYANTFSGGLFFGIGVFHILPEAVDTLSKYTKFPVAYILAFAAYSLILFIQRVIFGFMNTEEIEKKAKDLGQLEKEKISVKLKDPTLSKICRDSHKSDINKNNDNKNDIKEELIVPISETEQEKYEKQKKEIQNKRLTAYVMLLALSIHGIFECLALGIQSTLKHTVFLFIALMIHKWAEAFSLGIFFVKGKLSQKHYMLLIIAFSLIGPIGVVIGIILSATASELVEGIFLGVSTGTFMYVSCSEVIIEEFSEPDRRYIKFLLFMIGGVFAIGLTLFEFYFE